MFIRQDEMFNKKTWDYLVKISDTGTCADSNIDTNLMNPGIRVDAYVYFANYFVDICLSSQDMRFGTMAL